MAELKLPIYQVDAFASRAFEGNPAAVCPLETWLDDALMQSIAAENNLSETAFFVRDGDGYAIRWFTPTDEVDLCGHATLASACVLFECLGHGESQVGFSSRSGPLSVAKEGRRYVLDFPAQPPVPIETPEALIGAFGVRPEASLAAADIVLVFGSSDDVRKATPDLSAIASVDTRGVIITAADDDYDFVARFFGPQVGVDEDPVTGSAYTELAPYWAERLGKNALRARQVSARGGDVFCELAGDRVKIAGGAVLFLQGTINVPAKQEVSDPFSNNGA